jgi:UDP-N-acetylglucosamine 2-epimerase
MEGTDFLKLLANSKMLIGNSSVGIRECAYLGVPVVNIGSRQNRRDRGTNVIDVTYDKDMIIEAIQKHLNTGKVATSQVYGGGTAGIQIADLLEKLPLQFHKTITY